jgi:hypothetical protein
MAKRRPGDLFRGGAVDMQFEASAFLRNVEAWRQRFGRPLDQALRAAHTDMAIVVQQGQAERLRRNVARLGRPQKGGGSVLSFGGSSRLRSLARTDGTLANVLTADGNRNPTGAGFEVGIFAFLQASPARRYYRLIEDGMGSFWHAGYFFGGAKPGPTPPLRHMARTQVRFPSAVHPQRYNYRKIAEANIRREVNQGATYLTRASMRGPVAVQTKPFPGHRYSEGGVEAFRRLSLHHTYNDYLHTIGIRVDKHGQMRVRR